MKLSSKRNIVYIYFFRMIGIVLFISGVFVFARGYVTYDGSEIVGFPMYAFVFLFELGAGISFGIAQIGNRGK